MVSLIHDGFGEALKRWSGAESADLTTVAFESLTVPTGKSFEWIGASSERFRRQQGSTTFKVHANMSLRGDTIMGATFTHVAFANCDFRGAYFLDCSFDGVTLLNCRLDGAMFTDCAVIGRTDSIDPTKDSSNPVVGDFEDPRYLISDSVVPVSTLAGVVHRYVGGDGSAPALLADRAGRIAVPCDDNGLITDPRYGNHDSPAYDTWVPVQRGLAIYGSRLSALTFRAIRFVDEGRLSFRSVTGSGVDLVEMQDTDLEIFSSSLRHTSFTTAPRTNARVRIRAWNSVLTQTTFGRGLHAPEAADPDDRQGFVATDCVLSQVWNQAADEETAGGDLVFEVEARNSDVLDLVGVELIGCRQLPIVDDANGLEPSEISRVERVRRASDAMDYRRSTW